MMDGSAVMSYQYSMYFPAGKARKGVIPRYVYLDRHEGRDYAVGMIPDMHMREEYTVSAYEIIDFHTHPFLDAAHNICSHKECFAMTAAYTMEMMKAMGVSKICGSVIRSGMTGYDDPWQKVRENNDQALALRAMYGDFYVPGFHVHADFVRESCEEIERMAGEGVRLIGELVPYADGWTQKYDCGGMDRILDAAEAHGMAVSFHSQDEDAMDAMVEKHPGVVFVAAHPGEYGEFCRHMERMKKSENYYLDISGYGIFRHGMLRHALDLFGAERFLYGSDYPTCNPAMYIGGVLLDDLITDAEKKRIFAGNARRILGLDE